MSGNLTVGYYEISSISTYLIVYLAEAGHRLGSPWTSSQNDVGTTASSAQAVVAHGIEECPGTATLVLDIGDWLGSQIISSLPRKRGVSKLKAFCRVFLGPVACLPDGYTTARVRKPSPRENTG